MNSLRLILPGLLVAGFGFTLPTPPAPAEPLRVSDGGHSYVFKQPENEEEAKLSREAMEGCPVEAIGEDGA